MFSFESTRKSKILLYMYIHNKMLSDENILSKFNWPYSLSLIIT